MVKVIVIGAAGKMGQTVIRCLKDFPELKLIAAIENKNCELIGKDSGIIAGGEATAVPIDADFAKAAKEKPVVIDFSSPSALLEILPSAVEHSTPLVIGTTGFNKEGQEQIRQAANKIPIVWSANMSFGVNLLLGLVEKTSKALFDYDVEIVEMHHCHKKDAPSGTALRIAEAAAKGRGESLEKIAVFGRSGMIGERKKGEIAIHTLRGGDVVGDHTIIFAGDGERIELTHKASNRECFARGALRAALWLNGKKQGLYTMKDVLGIEP
jgi:4-hydroxy-tetrahydrodipicolinate reductase